MFVVHFSDAIIDKRACKLAAVTVTVVLINISRHNCCKIMCVDHFSDIP